MASVFFVDVAEYEPLWNSAEGDSEIEVRRSGPYVELVFPDGITIDRVAAGVRHAIWYSGLAALRDARVEQFDKDALRVVAT